MRYAMLINGDDDAWESTAPDDLAAVMSEVMAWVEKLNAAGKNR